MDIASRIVKLKEEKGLNTNQLAKKAGLGYSTVYEVEIGKKQPTIATLDAICRALGITIPEFFNDEMKILPDNIRDFVLEPENHGLLARIKRLKERGMSDELITAWLEELPNSVQVAKKRFTIIPPKQTEEYTQDQIDALTAKLKQRLKDDPGFVEILREKVKKDQ